MCIQVSITRWKGTQKMKRGQGVGQLLPFMGRGFSLRVYLWVTSTASGEDLISLTFSTPSEKLFHTEK